jgi:hypothetical protein
VSFFECKYTENVALEKLFKISIDNPTLKFTIVYVFNIAIFSLSVLEVNEWSKNVRNFFYIFWSIWIFKTRILLQKSRHSNDFKLKFIIIICGRVTVIGGKRHSIFLSKILGISKSFIDLTLWPRDFGDLELWGQDELLNYFYNFK